MNERCACGALKQGDISPLEQLRAEVERLTAENERLRGGALARPKVEPPLADHFYVPLDPSHPVFNGHLAGCSVVLTCKRCNRPGDEHPSPPKQEHSYEEGATIVPDWERWGTLGCVTCDRPRWEHPGPDPKDFI